MNFSLYKQMMKINLKGFMNYALGSAFYILLMFWLYPSIAHNSKSIDELLQSLPQGITSAFNLQGGFGSIETFISGEYYGLILVIILSIFSVLLSTQLLAKLVDQGSMAYLLSTPTTRGKVALTQAGVLASGLLLIMAATTISGFAGYAWFISDESEFHAYRFIQLNLAAFLLFFAVGGISFLVSSLANDEKKAFGISGAIAFIFFSLDLVGKINENIAWLRHFTLFSLFKPSEIVTGHLDWVQLLILFAIGCAAFSIGIFGFKRRDLPL